MISYQYTYLIGDLILLIIWLILFFWRKDSRKEMIKIGIIFGIIAVITAPIYFQDWWKPLNITGTTIGFEDFLFGLLFGGLSAVIYTQIFNKKIKFKKIKNKKEKRKENITSIMIVLATLFLISFFILELNSFYSSIISFVIPTAIIWFKRKDLIKNSIISGVLTLILAILAYHILNFITPEFFEKFWLFKNIGRVFFIGIPLEEIIWFFLAGAFIGPLYEYWQEGKLINIKN